jgi:stage II sporulation protein M
MVGFVLGQAAHLGYNPLVFMAVTILPHGVFELTAAMLTAALSVKLGLSVMSPPPGLSIGQAVLAGLANLLKIAGLVLLLLLVAAVIEAWGTPALALWFYGH